jgi:hypothetical protein
VTIRGKGYDPVALSNVPITANQATTRDAVTRFDWAGSAAGAAITAVSDDTGGPFGCGAAQVSDQLLGTGWSPFNPDSSDPENPHTGDPTLTVRLAAPVDITEFGLDPGSTCGDDLSATAREYRIETSPDGQQWTLAKDGSASANGAFTYNDAHRLNLVKPAAGDLNVSYVRLTLLSSQGTSGSGADFIDFSELEVYGATANKSPAGTLSAAPQPVQTGQAVTLTASFSDPDSPIAGYDWDFNGDGTADQTTTTASTTTTYATAGARTARVSVRDGRRGVGTASASVTVIAPPARPKVKIAASGRRSVKVTVTCDSACSLKGTLKVTTKLKRKLGLASRTVGRLRGALTAAGTKAFRLKLTAKTRRAMRTRRLRSLRAAAAVTATDAEKQKVTARKRTRIRR